MSIATKCTCGWSVNGICYSSIPECRQLENNEQFNPALLKVMQEAEGSKEDDLKKVKEEVKEKYSPATCEHRLPNGFSSWMFHSETSGSGPDFYHDVSVCVCTQCGTIRVAGFRQGKDGKRNKFNEEIDIHAEEAIDAIIKYANYIREETVWGRINQLPAEAEIGKAQFYHFHKWLSNGGYSFDGEYYYDDDNNFFTPDQIWERYKPETPKGGMPKLSEPIISEEEFKAWGKEEKEQRRQQGVVWVKEWLPKKAGDYYCKCKVDGEEKS